MRSPRISREGMSKIRRLRAESGGSAELSLIGNGNGVVSEKTSLLELKHHLQTTSIRPDKQTSRFEPRTEPPPLLEWLIPALTCAMCYALYNIFIKKGSASIHPILGGAILQVVAAVLGALLCSYLTFGPPAEPMFYDSSGLLFAILAGVAVGAAEMLSFLVNGMGVPAMQSIPVIIGGSVMFGCVIGWIFLGEVLSLRGWFGVLMIAVGIVLVGMESEGEGH